MKNIKLIADFSIKIFGKNRGLPIMKKIDFSGKNFYFG